MARNIAEVLSRHNYINARKLARELEVSTRSAGRILKLLEELGIVELYRRRRGRFWIYKVNKEVLTTLKLTSKLNNSDENE